MPVQHLDHSVFVNPMDARKSFNIASYALLTHVLAQPCSFNVCDFIWTGGDHHLDSHHFVHVEWQQARELDPFPSLHIKRQSASIFDYELDDYKVLNYPHHPVITAPVAV